MKFYCISKLYTYNEIDLHYAVLKGNSNFCIANLFKYYIKYVSIL